MLAEIVVGHPSQSVSDQLNTLLVQKTINESQHRTLVQAIDGRACQLFEYEDVVDSLEVLVAPNSVVRVSKYKAPQGFAPGQVMRVVTKTFASPEEELTWHVDLLRKSDASLDYGQALDRIAKESPELWSRYIQAQRAGIRTPSTVTKQVVLSREDVHKMADARLAQTPDQSKEQALMALVLEHSDNPIFYETYRAYHTSGQALQDHHARRLAKRGGQSL